jgi:uncharacterized protein YqgV (UPF0045/DUF77 family)
MKKIIVLLVLCFGLSLAPSMKAHAVIPWTEIIKKIIKAIDLAVQKLQNKTIGLQNAQKALENTMSKLKLDEITNWVNKQKELYQQYYDELKKVKAIVAYYRRIKTITDKQVQLVGAYKRAFALFKNDRHFTVAEISYMEKVYEGILAASVKNLDQVHMVITSFTTSMTDEARLAIIDGAADALDKNYRDLAQFNTQNKLLSLHRSRDLQEAAVVRALYGIH